MWHREIEDGIDRPRIAVDSSGEVWAFGNPRTAELWVAGPGADGPTARVPVDVPGEFRNGPAVIIDDADTAFVALSFAMDGGYAHRVFRYDLATSSMVVHAEGLGEVAGLAFDPSGNLLVAGDGGSDAPVDAGVSKYATDGTLLWRWPGEATRLRSQFARADPAGNVYVLHFVPGDGRNDDALSKLSPDGAMQWQIVLSDHLVNFGLGVGADGTAYVAGAVNRDGPPDPMEPQLDLRVHAFASDGTESWQWQGQSSNLGPNNTRVVVDRAGQIFVTWHQTPPDVPLMGDLVLNRFTPGGELCWSRTGEDLFPLDLAITDGGAMYVAMDHSYARVLP